MILLLKIFTCQYHVLVEPLRIGLNLIFLRIDAGTDRPGPRVSCHASESVPACSLDRCSPARTGPARAPLSSSSLVPPSLLLSHNPRRRPQHSQTGPPPPAMVFKDESSEDTSILPYMHSTSSMDGFNQVSFLKLGLGLGFQIWGFLIWPLSLYELLHVPSSPEDPDYKGLELDLMSPCEKHVMASERLVAFEGHMHEVFSMCTAGMYCRILGILIFFLTWSVPY